MVTHDHQIEWDGMAISIRHAVNWCGTGFDHLEIRTVQPDRAPLPITETGYRSHFLHGSEIEAWGNAVLFVFAWLDAEAESEDWNATRAKSRQLSLF